MAHQARNGASQRIALQRRKDDHRNNPMNLFAIPESSPHRRCAAQRQRSETGKRRSPASGRTNRLGTRVLRITRMSLVIRARQRSTRRVQAGHGIHVCVPIEISRGNNRRCGVDRDEFQRAHLRLCAQRSGKADDFRVGRKLQAREQFRRGHRRKTARYGSRRPRQPLDLRPVW